MRLQFKQLFCPTDLVPCKQDKIGGNGVKTETYSCWCGLKKKETVSDDVKGRKLKEIIHVKSSF